MTILISSVTRGQHDADAAGERRFPAADEAQARTGTWLLLTAAVMFGALANDVWLFIIGMSLIMGIVAMGTMAVVGYLRETTLMQAGLTGTAILHLRVGLPRQHRRSRVALPRGGGPGESA